VKPLEYIRLWEDETGDLVGYMWYQRRGMLTFEVHPRHQIIDLMREMFDWGEQQIDRAIAQNEEEVSRRPRTSLYANDSASIEILGTLGYAYDSPFLFFNVRSLADPIANVPVPEGFTVRNLTAEDDVSARVDVHRKAFDSLRVSVESYQNLMRAPGYLPDLDIVAVAPDGRFVSYCTGWLDTVNRVGNIEPMGTHPDFQRLGLGKAVIAEVLRRFQAHGATSAIVCSDEDNPAANRLYTTSGFHPAVSVDWYCKSA